MYEYGLLATMAFLAGDKSVMLLTIRIWTIAGACGVVVRVTVVPELSRRALSTCTPWLMT